MKPDAGYASQRTADTASSTLPTRPIGRASLSRSERSASLSPGKSDIAVSIGPGLMALMRMPWPMASRAAVRVRALAAALEAA